MEQKLREALDKASFECAVVRMDTGIYNFGPSVRAMVELNADNEVIASRDGVHFEHIDFFIQHIAQQSRHEQAQFTEPGADISSTPMEEQQRQHLEHSQGALAGDGYSPSRAESSGGESGANPAPELGRESPVRVSQVTSSSLGAANVLHSSMPIQSTSHSVSGGLGSLGSLTQRHSLGAALRAGSPQNETGAAGNCAAPPSQSASGSAATKQPPLVSHVPVSSSMERLRVPARTPMAMPGQPLVSPRPGLQGPMRQPQQLPVSSGLGAVRVAQSPCRQQPWSAQGTPASVQYTAT